MHLGVAVAQIDCVLGDPTTNAQRCAAAITEAAAAGGTLVVLPECALTGYMFVSAVEARESAVQLDGPEVATVVVAVANRSDHERGTTFVGRSQIVRPDGTVAAIAGEQGESVLVAEVDLADARAKRVLHHSERYETDVLADRRPELYSPLTQGQEGERIEP